MTDHKEFMRMAIHEARMGVEQGEQPFGAVVTLKDQVVCRTRSLKVAKSDSTAHAETLAVRTATQELKQRSLHGCVLYTTCEPCPMCLGAMLNVGIEKLVIGVRIRDLQKIGGNVFDFGAYSAENFATMVGWDLKVESGILADECIALYDKSVPLSR